MDKRKLITLTDVLIIGIFVIAAAGFYVFSTGTRVAGADTAEIRIREETVKTVSLEEDRIFSLAGHPEIQFIVSNGRIAFHKSDCPDQICVRNGFLHLAGQSSVCLPNRVILTIVSPATGEDEIDFFLN